MPNVSVVLHGVSEGERFAERPALAVESIETLVDPLDLPLAGTRNVCIDVRTQVVRSVTTQGRADKAGSEASCQAMTRDPLCGRTLVAGCLQRTHHARQTYDHCRDSCIRKTAIHDATWARCGTSHRRRCLIDVTQLHFTTVCQRGLRDGS